MSGRERLRTAVALLVAAATAVLAFAGSLSSKPWTPVLIGAGQGAWICALLLDRRNKRRR